MKIILKSFFLTILIAIILLGGGYFIYNKIITKQPTDDIQNNDENNGNNENNEIENIPNLDENIPEDNMEDIENQNQFNYFVEALEVTATITLIKTGIVPDFTTVYNEQPYKYECEEKKVNNNGTIYLKNCKIGNNYYSYGEILDENQDNNNFSKLYVFKDNVSDGYYVLNEIYDHVDKQNLLYVYNCKSKFCTYKFYDDKIFISDINLYYKDLNSNDTNLEILSPTNKYDPNKSNINSDFYFEYYKLETFDVYRTVMYASNSIFTPTISFDKTGHGIMFKEYYSNGAGYWYLSFDHKTLDNGYYLYASIHNEDNKQNDAKYIFDFFNGKHVYNFEVVKDDYFYIRDDKFFVGNYEFDEEDNLTKFKEVEIIDENLTIKNSQLSN